ncbi:sodium/proline symporter PutP [Clostridia bacterium]|nr:sodium/proline symporter PutP [Clostridia bacterium]
MESSIIITFLLYLLFMLFVGIYFYKRTSDLSDYILGGRGLNYWVTALSAQASDMSGWLLMGLPGAAYLAGLESVWIAVGLAVGTYLNWKYTAKRLRVYTEVAGNALTLSDYFQNRFHDKSNVLRIATAVFILIFFLIYTASGLVAGGKLFSTVFGFQYQIAVAVGALAIITYTFLGGFMAVSWTDFFQGSLMFLAILLVPAVSIVTLGGFGASQAAIAAINPEMLNPFSDLSGGALSWMAVVSSLAWGFGYFGQPHILSRFMAIEKADEIKKSRTVAMIWVIISLFCAVIVGMLGRAIMPGLEGASVEKVFMLMVQSMFNPWIAGIMLAAILAAIMSTADSQLLVTASAISQDIYRPFIKPNASQKELVWVGRITVIVVALIAFIIALNPNNKVLDLVAYAWAGFGSAFGPAIIISLFWKRMTRNGAIAGILTGGIVALVWQQLSGGLFDLYEIVPGFILASIAIIIVSKMGEEPDEIINREFEKVLKLAK